MCVCFIYNVVTIEDRPRTIILMEHYIINVLLLSVDVIGSSFVVCVSIKPH